MNGQNKTILNKKKAIGAYEDLTQTFKNRENQDYKSNFGKDRSIFKKYENLCAHTYNSAHRFGVTNPFFV